MLAMKIETTAANGTLTNAVATGRAMGATYPQLKRSLMPLIQVDPKLQAQRDTVTGYGLAKAAASGTSTATPPPLALMTAAHPSYGGGEFLPQPNFTPEQQQWLALRGTAFFGQGGSGMYGAPASMLPYGGTSSSANYPVRRASDVSTRTPSPRDSRRVADRSRSRSRSPSPATKDKATRAGMCFQWNQGNCRYGSDCKFAHVGPAGQRLPRSSGSGRSAGSSGAAGSVAQPQMKPA
jgi:hypothetical protein